MGELRRSILRKSFAQRPKQIEQVLQPAQSESAVVASHSSQSHVPPAKWELSRIVTGHSGWIHSIAFDPDNEFYATGSADQTIKIWSLQTGELKLTLTGHKMAVRAVTISEQLPYLFSAGEDAAVYCWDLEHNQIVRHFHGHRSGVYCAALHPSIPNILVTGSRDSTARVWDVRTRVCVHVLQGHESTINSVAVQEDAPQIITGSQDCTVRLWDLVSGRCQATLTQAINSVRSLAVHPNEQTFVSGGRDGIRQWKLPEGKPIGTLGNFENDGVTMMTLNEHDNSLFAGYDSGHIRSYDYATGRLLDTLESVPLPGSLNSEAAVLCGALDVTRSRLVTGHMDKSIRVWRSTD